MQYAVLLHPKAHDFFKNIDKDLELRLKQKIKELREKPESGKKLKYSDFHCLRIGEYRVIYEIDSLKKQVIVLYIGHKKNVYDNFSRLF